MSTTEMSECVSHYDPEREQELYLGFDSRIPISLLYSLTKNHAEWRVQCSRSSQSAVRFSKLSVTSELTLLRRFTARIQQQNGGHSDEDNPTA